MREPRIIELDDAVSRIKQASAVRSNDSSPFFLMVGAGISYPSVPLAMDIVSECRQVAQTYGRTGEAPGSNGIDLYSHWFQTAYAEPYQRQEYLRKLIEGKPITHANFRLAHLLLDNTISNIVVTTNFDDFLSRALALFGKSHIVCDHPQTVGRINHNQPLLQIVHLHGSYWFYDCCNLRDEMETRALQSQQTTLTMASLLDMILWDRSPLIIGYSGWEGDVFTEALKRRLKRSLRSNAYWFCYRRSEVDSLSDLFKYHPNITFVVPPKKPHVDVADSVLESDQSSLEASEIKGSSATRDDEPVLPADRVLDKLIRAFDLSAPELTKDPLGFFATHLDSSLPKDSASDAESDVYAIKQVIERVRRAKQRDDAEAADSFITPSQSQLEQVRDAMRRADYREAITHGTKIDLKDLSIQELDELADAMWSAARGVGDNSEQEILAYDTIIVVREYLSSSRDSGTVAGEVQLAKALYNKAFKLGELNLSEEAVAVYDEVVRRFGEEPEPALREQVAKTLYNKGVRLSVLNRSEEAVAAYDEVVRRFGEEPEPILREQVAKSLYNKGVRLSVLNRSEEAIAAYDEVVRRYGEEPEPILREQVAKALYNKAFRLGVLNRSDEEIAVYDEVVRRYGEEPEPVLREQVAKALLNKGFRLGVLNRTEEEIVIYDDIVRRYGEELKPVLREQVAKALRNKGVRLGELNRSKEAVAIYDEVVRRFGEEAEPVLREQVAKSLYNKGVRLGELNRSEEAIAIYDEVVRRFGEEADPVFRQQAAKSLYNKGVRLGDLNRSEEAIAIYDEVVRRFGEETEPVFRQQVAKALHNKGVRLRVLNRRQEAIAANDELVRRYGEEPDAIVTEQVAKALVNKLWTLGELNRSEESIAVSDQVVQRYGAERAPVLQEQVAKALRNKGLTLGKLDRSEEAIAAYEELVRRYEEATEPTLRSLVGSALNGIAFRLLVSAKAKLLDGDKNAALKDLRRAHDEIIAAIERAPDDATRLGNHAYILFLLGQMDEARQQMTRALALGGERIRSVELKDAEINRLPQDEEFCEMVRSIPLAAD